MELLGCFEPSNNTCIPENVFNNIKDLDLSPDKPIKKVPSNWKLYRDEYGGTYLGNIDGNAAGYTGGDGGNTQSGGVNTNYLSSCDDKDDWIPD